VASRNSGGNGNSPFLFIRHPVHNRFAVMNFTDFVRTAGIIQYPLCNGCLSGIDMGDNTDISYIFNVTLFFLCTKSMLALNGKRISI
jgi:hypothetical protein